MRVIVIGLDGGTFNLLKPFARKGYMPNFGRLLNESAYGKLESTKPPVTAPAWASFQTGKNPGKHGLSDFTLYQKGSYEAPFINSGNIKAKTLWEIISEYGKKVGVINVPVTYPPKKVNGFMISGLLTPSLRANFTYPEHLRDELTSEIGHYTLHIPSAAISYKGLYDFVDSQMDVAQGRAKAAFYLMEKYEWDFFMVHFQSLDAIQHALWSHLDSKHRKYHSTSTEEREYVLRYYEQLDCLLGEIINLAGEDTVKIVMSDHGFGPVYKRIYINQWLANEGLLSKRLNSRRLRWVNAIENLFKKVDFLNLRRRLTSVFGGVESLRLKLVQDHLINWPETQAFASYGYRFALIRINLKGREAMGKVKQGQEYDQLKYRIMKRLGELRDPQTGEKVIKKIYTRDDIYWGSNFDFMPDLVVEPMDGYCIATRLEDGLLFKPTKNFLTGDHMMDGIIVMSGDVIKKDTKINGAKIIDLAPTILHLLDIPVPQNMDGDVLEGALTVNHLAQNPILYRGEKENNQKEYKRESYSDEENAAIRKRLKDLGYLE